MHLKFKKILILILFLFSAFLITQPIFASIDDDINALTKQIADLEAAIAPLKKESTDLKTKIALAKKQITSVESQISDLSQKLVEKGADLEVQKLLMSERVKRYYKNSKNYNSFFSFIFYLQ